jgi:hypothetical protein
MIARLLLRSACLAALAGFIPIPGTATPPIDSGALRAEAARLIDQVSSLEKSESETSGLPERWAHARPGAPLPVYGYGKETPAYAILPVFDPEDRIAGWIGLDPATGRWQWFTRVEADAPAPLSPEIALRHLRERFADMPAANPQALRLLSMPGGRLCWFLGWTNPGGATREGFVDFFDSGPVSERESEGGSEGESKLGSELGSDRDRLRPEPADPVVLPAPPRGAALRDLPIRYYIDVPFFYQQTPTNCGPASLQMVFDYWGPEIRQPEIALAAHTIPADGTPRLDLQRAAHFSRLSRAYGDSSLVGYTRRPLGYAAPAASWASDSQLADRALDLKRLVFAGYPPILLTWYDASFGSGHYRVLKGYDDRLDVFVVHDPWYSGSLMGPDLFLRQGFLLDVLWAYPGGGYWGMLVCPWSVTVAAPDTIETGRSFTVSAVIDYPGPHPFERKDPVTSATARIDLPAGFALADGQDAVLPLDGITASASLDTVIWRIRAPLVAMGGRAIFTITAAGMFSGSSPSYPEYTDEIGAAVEKGIVTKEPTSLFVIDFESRTETEGVHLSWETSMDVAPVDLKLVAIRDGLEWEVGLEGADDRRFIAYDRNARLAGGTTVTYRLSTRRESNLWEPLFEETVQIGPSFLATRLLGALPNPSAAPASVCFVLDRPLNVRLAIFDAAGRSVVTLADGPHDPGWHAIPWNGRDASGKIVGAGVYVVRLDGPGLLDSRRIVLLR